LEGCSKNREVIFQKVRSSLALSGTGAWFGTRDFKSRVGEFFCFPIGAPEMGVVKHATLPSAYLLTQTMALHTFR